MVASQNLSCSWHQKLKNLDTFDIGVVFPCPTLPIDGFSEAQLSWFRNLRPVHCCPLGAGSQRECLQLSPRWKHIVASKSIGRGDICSFFLILEFNFWTSLRHEMSICVFDRHSWIYPFPQPCTRLPYKFLLRCYPFTRFHPVKNKAASNFFQEWDRKHSALLSFPSHWSHTCDILTPGSCSPANRIKSHGRRLMFPIRGGCVAREPLRPSGSVSSFRSAWWCCNFDAISLLTEVHGTDSNEAINLQNRKGCWLMRQQQGWLKWWPFSILSLGTETAGPHCLRLGLAVCAFSKQVPIAASLPVWREVVDERELLASPRKHWCSSLEHGPFCQRLGDPGLYDQIAQVQRESSAQIERVMADPRVCRFIQRAIGAGWWCAVSANVRTLSGSFSLELQTCGCPGAMFMPRKLAISLFWLEIHLDAWRALCLTEMSCFASQAAKVNKISLWWCHNFLSGQEAWT